jgi:hypothetical protein
VAKLKENAKPVQGRNDIRVSVGGGGMGGGGGGWEEGGDGRRGGWEEGGGECGGLGRRGGLVCMWMVAKLKENAKPVQGRNDIRVSGFWESRELMIVQLQGCGTEEAGIQACVQPVGVPPCSHSKKAQACGQQGRGRWRGAYSMVVRAAVCQGVYLVGMGSS